MPPLIRTDADAYRVLENALRNKLELAPDQQIKLKGWPTITLTLTGDNYEGTITAATAKALIEVQRAVDRAYLSLARPYSRRLTDEEKRKAAITARVENGSSVVNIELGDAFTRIASDLVTKMNSTDIIITLLGLGMIAGGTAVARQYIKSRAEKTGKEKELASQIALSGQETKRLQIVTEAMRRQPVLTAARDDFDEARDEMMRSGSDANTVNLDGVTLTGLQARVLPREPRSEAEGAQLNGTYLITGVLWPTSENEALLDLRSTEGSREFRASLSTRSLIQKDKDLLAAAEWNRTPIYLQINAHLLRGEVTRATIVGFDWEKLRGDGAAT